MREPMRHKGRSLLIVALIALPVVAMAFLSIIYRTQALSPGERATRVMGQADATVAITLDGRIIPPDPTYATDVMTTGPSASSPAEGSKPQSGRVKVSALLPPGSRLHPIPPSDSVVLTAAGRRVELELVGAPYVRPDGPDPITRGSFRLQRGSWPRKVDQVALSPSAATRFHAALGSLVTVSRAGTGTAPTAGGATGTGRELRVVGIAADPGCLACDDAFALDAVRAAIGAPASRVGVGNGQWLVTLPAGSDPHRLWHDLAARGVSFLPRAAILHPDRYVSTGPTSHSFTSIAIGAVVVGFGLLEVVLLAGTAFAVGAKRQVRELGLLGACGGEARDVRRVVLAQGAVLGLAGGVAGVALGFVAVLAGWSGWEKLAGKLFGGVVVRPGEIAAIAAFGVLAGVLAAVVPAVSASRMSVVAALGNRFVPPHKAMRRPLIGLGMIVGGAVLAFVTAAAGHALAAHAGATTGTAVILVAPAVLGIGVVAVGIMLATPALVAGLGAVAHRMPLVPRLAARDAGRHRHRTAPAIAAVSLAVAGTIAIGFVVSGNDHDQRAQYQQSLPLGWSTVYVGSDVPASERNQALTAATHQLGASPAVPVVPAVQKASGKGSTAGGDNGPVQVVSQCFAVPNQDCGSNNNGGGDLVVATAAQLPIFLGHAGTAAVRAAFDSGRVIVRDSTGMLVRDGSVHLLAFGTGSPTGRLVPAYAVPAPNNPRLGAGMVSAAGARKLGYFTDPPTQFVLRSAHVPSQSAEDRANAALAAISGQVTVERGYQSAMGIVVAVLGGASGLVTVAGVAIAVGLAAVEGRADLATLAAVGAAPRRRRALAVAQAAVVGGIGVLVGVAFGALIGGIMIGGFHVVSWSVPWLLLLVVVLGVPAVAMAVAGVFTRSRLPMLRRIA